MPKRETVVLVHGLWMTGVDMILLRWRIRDCGFTVRQFSYSSLRVDVGTNAARLQRFISLLDADTIHLVGHSLGGLVIGRFLHDISSLDIDRRIGRVVTLGTPYKGSRVARKMATISVLRWSLGRSFVNGLDGRMPAWPDTHELGVIAGTLNLGVGRLVSSLPGVSDGSVMVDETRTQAMTDHITLPVSHTALLFSSDAARQVCAFLHNGRFKHEQPAESAEPAESAKSADSVDSAES